MKIAICDDEQIFRDTLYKKLVKYNKTFEIKEFRTGRELIDSRIKFDIIFLDIAGIDTLDRIFDDATVFMMKGDSYRGKKLETIAIETGRIKTGVKLK